MRGNMRGRRNKRINYKRLIMSLIILVLLIVLIGFGIKKLFSKSGEITNNPETKQEEKVIPPDITINLVATGDIMCHSTNFKAAYNNTTKTYDFSPVFTDVAKYITKADIAIGNLETTFAGEARGYSGYPTFNSPKELGIAIKNIGIDVLSTANNHSIDKGESGIISTLDTLDEIGIEHTGTYRSKEEQNKILVKEVNGIKIAFLSFTYGTNGIPVPKGKEYLVNLIDKNLMLEQINLAKEQNVDIICTSMHWGVEYAQKQNKEQEELADFLFKNGVDIIIGNHAHVIEPMQRKSVTLEDGTEKEVFVVYALGNFVSGQVKEHTKSTAILDMQITKSGETGKISIDSVNYVPVYCYDKGAGVQNRYKLIDIRAAMAEYNSGNTKNVNMSLYNTLKQELANIEKVLGEPIAKKVNTPEENTSNTNVIKE